MVAADDDVGAAEILPDDGMVDGLPRTRVPHLHLEDGHDSPLLEVVVLDQLIVGGQDDLVLEIALFLPADDRVDENAVGEGQGRLLHVFVADMRGVPGLEGDDRLPAFFPEQYPRLLGAELVPVKRRRRNLEKVQRSGQKDILHRGDLGHSRMGPVHGQEDFLGQLVFVVLIFFLQVEDGDRPAALAH